MDRLTPEEERLVADLAAALMPMGVTPIEARIHGLLTVSPEPLTLDQIVVLLDVSKSSASVATRELERHGAARRFPERGSKRIRYGVTAQGGGFLDAQVAFLAVMGGLLRDRADAARDARTRERLRAMGRFHLRVRDALAAVLAAEADQ